MKGLKFDFAENDLVINEDSGEFETAQIDSQNIALIAISQICRVGDPRLGAQIGSRIINQPISRASVALGEAQRMAERDGATGVNIQLTADGKLYFNGAYEDNS